MRGSSSTERPRYDTRAVPRPRPLSARQARSTLAHRLGHVADRLRQIATDKGVRPYRTFLVWVRWSGRERGEGVEHEIGRVELLPAPKVENLDNVAYRFFSGGILPAGSIRVSRISVYYTADQLTGLAVPNAQFLEHNEPPHRSSALALPRKPSDRQLPEPLEFYWEVAEDGRGDAPPERTKYRLAATPYRNAAAIAWEVLLERVSVDENRDGTLNSGYEPDG
jgi:hypothetical protein